jgi:hypothetical protein
VPSLLRLRWSGQGRLSISISICIDIATSVVELLHPPFSIITGIAIIAIITGIAIIAIISKFRLS